MSLGHSIDLAWEDRLGLSRQTRFLSQNYEGQIMTYSLKSLTIQTGNTLKFQETVSRKMKVYDPLASKLKDELVFCYSNTPKREI